MRGVLPCIESSRSGNDRQPQQFGGWERPWRVSDVIHLGFEGGEAHLRLDHVKWLVPATPSHVPRP